NMPAGAGFAGRELDSVDGKKVPLLADKPELPVAVTEEPAAMPAYGGGTAPAEALSLAQVYTVALANDPILRAAYSELQAATHGTSAAWSGFFPNVWAQGTYSSVTQNVKQSENTVYQQGKANWTE